MHTYILERYGRNKFLVREGWNIKSWGNIFYSNDDLIGRMVPEDDYYFDHCWVYWNKKAKRFCHLNYDRLNELSKIRIGAMNNATTKEAKKAMSDYYDYLANPEFLTGEEEMKYVLLHRYPFDFADLVEGKENQEELDLFNKRLEDWKKQEGIE